MNIDSKTVDTTRKLIRPVVTIMFVITLCACVLMYAINGADQALEAATYIGAPVGFILEKWFSGRQRERENGRG